MPGPMAPSPPHAFFERFSSGRAEMQSDETGSIQCPCASIGPRLSGLRNMILRPRWLDLCELRSVYPRRLSCLVKWSYVPERDGAQPALLSPLLLGAHACTADLHLVH